MKRTPIALVPWMVLATAAYGQTRNADVIYTHHDDVPTRAFRVGDECFVPLDFVARWGWTTSTWADTADVHAEGKKFSLPFRTINGQKVLPLRAALKKLGADCDWIGTTDTLQVFTTLTSASVRDGKIRLEAPIEFRPRATLLSDPSRLVVDLTGVRIDPKTKLDLETGARLIQYKQNVVRLIVETQSNVDLDRLNSGPTKELEAVLPKVVEIPKAPLQEEPKEVETVPTPQSIVPTTGRIEVRVEAESKSDVRLRIPIVLASQPVFRKPDPTTLEVVLPGTSVSFEAGYQVASASIVGVSSRVIGSDTVLSFTLSRPMGAQVVSGVDGVGIQLQKPDVGDGRLAGKLIVVDPGHGGKDRGANAGGVFEKDLNLIMGKLIAEELAKEGATVIMTRKTDVFIPLNTRAQIANQNRADLFVSSHINSTGGSGSQSGGITFHHLGKGTSRVLAECIQSEIARVSGIPNLGVWSDGKIYRSGFAVLRQTSMPGVLLELGFINHPRDRKRLVQDDFQRSVAAAVVRGIKVYLGDAKKND